MERYFIAPDDIRDENGGLLFSKGQRVQSDERSPAFAAEALAKMGLVDERQYKAPEPGALEAVNTVVDETARGNLGELFEDPTGESSTPAYIAKTALQGAADSVVHGAVGVEKGIVGGVLDTVSAGARVLGGDKLADQLQQAKRFNDEVLMDTKPADDLLLGGAFDNSREAWEKVMGVSEGLGSIAGGVAAAKPLAAGLQGAKVAKTAEGAMKGAFAAQMAAGGEENARKEIEDLRLKNEDSRSGPSVESPKDQSSIFNPQSSISNPSMYIAYHTLKEAIKSQFFGRVVGAFGKKIGNAGAAALEFGGINAADVLADAYIGDTIAGREWKDENGNILVGNEKDMAVLQKAGAEFLYGGMQSLLMSMGGALQPRKRLEGVEKLKSSEVEKLKSSRQKAAAAMVQAAADPESAAVAARGANGETLMKNGCLVRPVEEVEKLNVEKLKSSEPFNPSTFQPFNFEVVTPDGVVLDAEGKVKTVTAGNVGETGEGSYGTAITVRTNPLTGRPTAARETVRNALVALQEGVTIDLLRESDGWTPENEAVFQLIEDLRLKIEDFAPGELVDAYAGLGISREELTAFGLLPDTPIARDAEIVARNGTTALQSSILNPQSSIPLDIAAEVARSVNAGTTGLMPKDLAKRQLETARQILSERRASALQESAAEHGNTPEAERAVLDTPVERPDGSLASLEEACGQDAAKDAGAPEGRPEAVPLQGTAGMRPAPSGEPGVFVHGTVPEAKVRTGVEINMPDGAKERGVLVEGLDPAEMLRPERREAVTDFLIELMEGAQGNVAFESPEVEAAARELLQGRVAKEEAARTGELVEAGQRLVDNLFGEESGIKVRKGTDAERMEAAEGAVGKNASVELLRDTAGEVKGYWDRAKHEVVLFDGATPETLGHEIAWHAVRQWAETSSPELLAKMNEYARTCPEDLRKLIEEAYKDFTGDALLDEIGAGRFESKLGARFAELLERSPEAKTWWEKVKEIVAAIWKAGVRAFKGNDIDLSKMADMDPEQAMEWLVGQMLEGRRLGEAKGMSGEGERLQLVDIGGVKVPTVTDLKEAEKIRAKSPESVKGYVMQHLEDNIKLLAGGTASITADTAHHYGWSPYNFATRTSGTLRKARARMATILSEILGQTKADGGTRENKPGKNGVGWRCTMPIGVPVLDNRKNVVDMVVYDADVIVKDQGHGKFLYDITRLKKNTVLTPGLANQRNALFGGGTQSTASGATALGKTPTPQSIPQNGGGAQAQIRPSIGGVRGAEKLGVGKAADAEQMEKDGASREEIWRKTGWWRAKDGRWRVELPDFTLKMDTIGREANESDPDYFVRKRKLPDIITDTRLFEAYPELKKITVETPHHDTFGGASVLGDYNGKRRIRLNTWAMMYDPEQVRSTLAHEIQHAIQYIEGFAKGGNEGQFKGADPWALRQKAKAERKRGNETEAARLEAEAEEIEENALEGHVIENGEDYEDTFEAYRSLSGETESRNVEKRLAMSPEERAATPPWATEDVPEDRQIIRFSRGGTGTGEKKKDVPTIGADMSEPGNAKAFRKYLSTRDAAPMPERLKDGRPRNVLQWFTENMVGKTFEFDIPGIGYREFRVKAGHLFRLVCDTPKGRSSSGKTIRKGFVGKAKDADEARRLIETGEVTTGDIAGWNEGRARSLPLIPEILESFDAVFREKARPGFLVFVKKFVSKSGHVNTVVMRLNEDGETLGPMSAHMKGITAEWLKGQDLAITDDGKVFTRQENSASSQVDSQDNAEGNSRANAESISQDGADGNGDLRLSRGGYKPGDWRKTFTFGKAARGAAEQTNGGIAAGEERRRWEENPVDERIPEWDAPARNPNIAKPFALSSAEGVRLVKLLGGTMKKPKAYKDAIGVIDESDEQRIRDDLKAMGLFKGDDFLWAATATPAEVAADRADSQAALDARLEKLGEQRLKGEAGGGNRGLVRVSMSQVADLVLSLPAETGGNLGNVRTLAQGIVRGFERDRTPEQAAYYFEEARNLLGWFYGLNGEMVKSAASQPLNRPSAFKYLKPRSGDLNAEGGLNNLKGGEAADLNAEGGLNHLKAEGRFNSRQLLARAFGAFLEAPDAVAERAPGLYREFVDAISRNDKLLHAFDAIRRTALGEGSAERVYAEIEARRTARAEEAARRLADEVEKPIGSRLERAKDSFVYNFDDMHGPIFMHITRAQKRQLAELKASLKAGRITQADYDAATAAFRQAVQGLKIAELKVDRGTQNEIRQYLWDMSFVFEQAKAAGVDPKDAQRYMDLRWIVSTGGRAGARGMSARDAQIVLDNMKSHMGDEAFARLEGVSAQFHAVREKNILDDPRLAAMIGQDRVNFFKNNVHYVRTERTRATPEELAKMEADRAAFRRENKGDDDVTAAMLSLLDKTGGRGGGIGNSTWGHALEGSVKDVKDRLAATWRNDTRLMAAMERNDFVIQMRDALLAAKAEGVHDLPGSRGVDYPQNARYGHIRYFENGKQRVLVVPRVLADGYRQVSDAMTGWSAWGKIAHGVFIDWNLAYTLRNMTRNMASNEANIVGMRADNATILGNAIAPGVGRAASMAAYQIARHLPSAAIRNPFVRAVWGEHVNAAYAGQAQRILELYLDPRKAVERRAAAEEARLRGELDPEIELESDLELMRFITKSGALIARWDEVHGAGRDADLFMQGRGLGPIYGEKGGAGAQPPSVAKKALNATTWIFRRNAQFNRDLELHAKITAVLAIHEMQPGLTAEQVGIEVARRASIPHAERRGANSKMINYAWNMFFNTALKGGLRFVGNVVRNPRLLGKMAAQSLGPQLFWATMIAGGRLAAVIRNMFGGGDDAEKKARQAGLGWLLDYTQFMHDGAFAASPYLQRFYHWCPLGQVGERYIGIALPRTDEEKMLLPFIDWAAAKLATQPTDPTATLGDAVKRGVVGTFVPDLTARTPLVAAAQDLVFAWWQNPMDAYRGTHVYDNSLFQARGESVADAAAFAGATLRQGFNDLGGRTIVRPRRNEIEVAEGSGAQPPSFAEKAWDIALNDIPVLSGVLGGSLRMTLTKEQRLDQIEREALAPIRAVKNLRSEELMKMMLESPVANNGSETPEIKEKLDAWAERYGWDEAERGNVFARAFNGYQAATAAGQELAAQKKEKNRRVRYNKMPNSEKKAVEAAGLREILSQ